MPTESEKDRLPFEPNSKRKRQQRNQPTSDESGSQPSAPSEKSASKPSKGVGATQKAEASEAAPKASRRYTREETSIPEVVSRRMLRRMAFFSGIPVTVGILTFFVSYVLIIQGIAELPNIVVLLVTLACFGLSVVGLSYGALSASWEENAVGTIAGLDEFKLNAGRLVNSWKEAREERRNRSGS